MAPGRRSSALGIPEVRNAKRHVESVATLIDVRAVVTTNADVDVLCAQQDVPMSGTIEPCSQEDLRINGTGDQGLSARS